MTKEQLNIEEGIRQCQITLANFKAVREFLNDSERSTINNESELNMAEEHRLHLEDVQGLTLLFLSTAATHKDVTEEEKQPLSKY